jgi:integral membrane protein (TIGR00529 family)
MALPALIKVLSCFALILALSRFRLHLSLCLIVGATALGAWMGMPPGGIVASLAAAVREGQTLELVAIISMILVVSQLMKVSGHLDRMVHSFVGLVRDSRTVSAVMPALIGLLPMPGGALFSAPMVETAVAGCSLSGDKKTAVNYWFRHIWEYWWPLYPGVVLALSLLQVETWRFIAMQAPLTLISVAAGTYFLLRPMEPCPSPTTPSRWNVRSLATFLWEAMPILLVVAGILLLALVRYALAWIGWTITLPKVLPLLVGLGASLLWVLRVNGLGLGTFLTALMNLGTLSMVMLVFGIMIFKGLLVDSQAVFQIREELIRYHIPLLLVIIAMPFLGGLITGIAVGFVGSSFPLVVPLFSGLPPLAFLVHASLAYAFGYMGMMLSPVHICFLVSKDYFKASLLASYRHLYKPVAAVTAIWVGVLAILSLL